MSHPTITQIGDNIYVNVTISNNDSVVPIVAEYLVSKTIPILNKCDDYFCSIIRFDIPLNKVPIFICPIIPGSLLTQKTPLIIGIRTGGVNYPINLTYIPDNTLSPVNQTDTDKQIITEYYFCYTYQILINMINNALMDAFNLSGLGGNPPYIYYDAQTKLINLIVEAVNFTNGYPAPPNATIFLNSQLLNYLEAIEVKFFGFNQSQGRDYEFVLSRSYVNSIGSGLVRFEQEYSCVNYWNSLSKILITANSIPIIPEYTPTNNSGISSTFPIISDFTPQLEVAGQSRSIAYYTPTTQYRLADLKSSQELNTIDLKIYWQDRNLNIYPLYISIYQEATLKIGFFKKSLYNGYVPLLKK